MWKIIQDNILIAFDSIRGQLVRAIITLLIIALGIMALVGTLTVVNGIENNFNQSLASLGSNKFTFKRYETVFGNQRHNRRNRKKINPPISYREAITYKKKYKFDGTVISISYFAASNVEAKSENIKSDPEFTVIGIDENYLEVNADELTEGKKISRKNIENNDRFAIISKDIKKALFKDISPIGRNIIINGNRFKIVGLLKSKGATFAGSMDNKIYIPINLARFIFPKKNANFQITTAVQNRDVYSQSIDKAVSVMRDIRGLKPIQENNFGMDRSDKLEEELKSVTKSLNILALIIGLITILGSSIALMNIMLVSVTERTREIGIRKAIGANRFLIMIQFFVETLVITVMGGLVGMILGILIGFGIAKMMKVDFSMPWNAIIAAFIVTFAVAFVSGLYPAYKASKLDPIQALRYE